MKIQDGIEILRTELTLGRSPQGRELNEHALNVVAATLQDKKNYDSELIRCLGCGFVASVLLSSQGCPNCNVSVMTLEIENKEQHEQQHG